MTPPWFVPVMALPATAGLVLATDLGARLLGGTR
jgi:hypothetical protein